MTRTKARRSKLSKKKGGTVEPVPAPAPKIMKKLKKKRKIKQPKVVVSSDSEADLDPQEKVQTLLEPFSKDQLIMLITDLSSFDNSLFALVKTTADQDISHRKVFVHGLGWDATLDLVESVFSAYGEIENVNVVTDRNTGKCKGYGFVTYKTRKAASKLLKNPKIRVGNRITSCQLAAEGPPGPAIAGVVSHQSFSSDYPQRKIYVSNVPENASADKLRSFFERFGEIESGPKGFDLVTGKSKGYALFVYKTQEGAQKALEEPFKIFEGQQLQCRKAAEGKNKVASGAASITTALQPVQPQMLAAVAAAQQVQNMALLGQQAGMVNPLFGGEMVQGANFGALMGGYYGMLGGPMHGLGLGAYGAPASGEVGSKAMLTGLQYMHPNMQSGQPSSSLRGNAARGSGGGYSPSM